MNTPQNPTGTKRYAFYPEGRFEVDEEQYPGQYDPIDLSEIEFSYEMHYARTRCVFHMPDKKFHVIVDDDTECEGETNNIAASFLLGAMPNVTKIDGEPLTWPICGNVVVVEVH